MNKFEQIRSSYEKKPKFPGHYYKSKKSDKRSLVYQYRNFQSFWQILQNDCFWATNARFSNDEAEQHFGMQVISSLFEDNEAKDEPVDLGLDDNYIVCFCLEDDKLSQWRGYASEGGVSMGFDFGMPRVFSILNSDLEEQGKNEFDTTNSVMQYVDINEVQYINPPINQDANEYIEYCKNQLKLISPENNANAREVYLKEIQKKAPYIKHSGFAEENECRLVFSNIDGKLNECVRYRSASGEMLKYPYIVIKAALPKDEESSCVVRICVEKAQEPSLVKDIERLLKDKISSGKDISVRGCHLLSEAVFDVDESFCQGCVLCHWQDLSHYEKCRTSYNALDNIRYSCYLYKHENCVIISQGENQQEVFEAIYAYVNNLNGKNKIKVWCEGHLPLRKITIGPCINQNSMAEAIRHYCKHKYWLRDVEIELSAIPFRRTL